MREEKWYGKKRNYFLWSIGLILLLIVIIGGIYFYNYSQRLISGEVTSGERCTFPINGKFISPFENEWVGWDKKTEQWYLCEVGNVKNRKLTSIECIHLKYEHSENINTLYEWNKYPPEKESFLVVSSLFERNYICSVQDYCRVFKTEFMRKFPYSKKIYEYLDCSSWAQEIDNV